MKHYRAKKEEIFDVETILHKRRIRDRSGKNLTHYLVKWRGYGHADNTWEPTSNLRGAASMVKKFNNDLIGKEEKMFKT